MAKVEIIQRICDMCGDEGEVERRIALDRKDGKVDLCTPCDERVTEFLAPILKLVAGSRSRADAAAREMIEAEKTRLRNARAWGVHMNMDVKERGRIPAGVIEAYMEAGCPEPPFEVEEVPKPKKRASKKAVPAARFVSA